MADVIASYFLMINIVSAYLMYVDKQRAIQKTWRIPESNLLFICLVGGFLGTYGAMKWTRHKTQNWKFHTAVIVATLIWLMFLPLFVFWLYSR